jgi:DNA-binding LacI/PurR family transcriptional regulator
MTSIKKVAAGVSVGTVSNVLNRPERVSAQTRDRVRQPREQLGRAATRLLLAEITGPQPHTHSQVMFEPELVVRESTAGRLPQP